MKKVDSNTTKSLGNYLYSNSTFEKVHYTNIPESHHVNEHIGYKTYYDEENISCMINASSNKLDPLDEHYVTDTNIPENIQYRSPTQKKKKKRKSTIYDENHYVIAQPSSSNLPTTSETSLHERYRTNSAAHPKRFCLSTKCYCFFTIWLVIFAATGVAVLVILIHIGLVGQHNTLPVSTTPITSKY